MEENLILYGCKLAKELEQNLRLLLPNQPETLLASCEEIINIFSSVRERLIVTHGQMMSFPRQPADHSGGGGGGGGGGGAGIQELLRSGGGATSLTPATTSTSLEPMDLLMSAQAMLGDRSKFYLEQQRQPASSSGLDFTFGGGRDVGRVGAVGEIQSTTNAPDSIRTSPPHRQPRMR